MDNINEYTESLERLKKASVAGFDNLSDVERYMVEQGVLWLAENMNFDKDKQITVTPELIHLLTEFARHLAETLTVNERYQTILNDYLSNVDVIGRNLEEFHTDLNNLNIEKAGLKPIQETVINGLIDAYTENGLNINFAQPLKDIIYRNVLAGMNLTQARGYLEDYILSNQDQSGKLAQYLQQTAQIGVDAYTGAINSTLYEKFKFTGFIMSGSLIETSSKQCVMGITEAKKAGGYLTNTQIDDLLKVARENKKAPLIEGTTRANLDINKFHWGCRHEFTPFIKVA